MTSDTHEIEKAGFRFDRLGFPEFTLCPLDRVKVSRNRAQAGAVCACRITRQFKKIVACTDPYARWWRRGGAVRLPPIPIEIAVNAVPAPGCLAKAGHDERGNA